jgi:hypothetical protein
MRHRVSPRGSGKTLPPGWTGPGLCARDEVSRKYLGPHVGAGAGTADIADPFGSSIFGDKVPTPGFLAGGQIGYNWQAPNSPWVFGLETGLDWLDSDGTNTCLAASGLFVSANCHA